MEQVTVPDTLQGLLMARLDRLPEEIKWVVQQAAVIGRIFLYRVLLQISQHAPGLDADLSHLERQELIREHARHPEVEYIFKHALTQEVAYQSLLTPRRKQLHRIVGEAVEVLFAERRSEFHSILATHFMRGEAWDRAVEYLIKAGDAAAGLYARAEARLHYAQALEALTHLPDTEENRRRRVDVTIKQAGASWFADPPERNLRRMAEAETVAQALAGPDGTSGGDRLRLARTHYWMGRFHYLCNEMREAMGYYRRVLVVAQESGDDELLAIPSSMIGRVRLFQGQFGQAGSLLAQAVAPLEKMADWHEWVSTVGFLSVALAARGQHAAGVAENERALARALETNNISGAALTHLHRCTIWLMGGDLSRMLESSRAAVEIAEQSGERLFAYVGHGYRGWAESRLGQHEAARESMAESIAVGQSLGGQLIMADWLAAAHAEIALNAGRIEEALALAEEAVALGKSAGSLFSEGLAHRVWATALAARRPPLWEEAEAHMEASLQPLEAGEAYLEAARTHLAWGLLRRDRGDAAAARDHFEKAAAQFEASGLVRELERTRRWLLKLK
jgi:predicted ATPase